MSKRNAPVAQAAEGREGAGSQAARIVRDEEKTGAARRASPVAWACLLIVWVVWGSTYLAIRVGVETMPPLLMAAARNLVAGLVMFPLAVFPARLRSPTHLPGPLRRRLLPSSLVPRAWGGVQGPNTVQSAPRPFGSHGRWPTRAEWAGCAVVGILLLVANGVVGVGEKTVPSGLAALLVATVPLWLLGIDAGLNHARLGLAPLAGLALGLAGVALLSGLGGGAHGTSVTGVVIILAAAAAWALGTIMARRVTIPSSPALASGMQLLCGGTVHPGLRAGGAGVRGCAPVELRHLRLGRAAPGLRRQRLRRDAARAVGVGCQAAGGQPGSGRPRQRVRRQGPPCDRRRRGRQLPAGDAELRRDDQPGGLVRARGRGPGAGGF